MGPALGAPGLAHWASRNTQGVRLEARALGLDRLEFKSIVPLPLKTIHPAFLNLCLSLKRIVINTLQNYWGLALMYELLGTK